MERWWAEERPIYLNVIVEFGCLRFRHIFHYKARTRRALSFLEGSGPPSGPPFSHWLSQAFCGMRCARYALPQWAGAWSPGLRVAEEDPFPAHTGSSARLGPVSALLA